jgi:nicotinamide-nucleotide amidase
MGKSPPRRLQSAQVLAIGTELTLGETRDTNSGDLAGELSALGVRVLGLAALPDDLATVTLAFERALESADLIVSTGGLGPTPDDLTREAIAEACGETPEVDPALVAWLEDLFARRGHRMADRNRKQAWLIPGARPIPNPNGTAPGWWVDRPDGQVIVAVPGPPRALEPMWRETVLSWLGERGLGSDRWSRTLHLTGIGESALADLIGDEILRATNPAVATYARADSVDVRVSAIANLDGPSAERLGKAVLTTLEERLAAHLFARDAEGWIEALGARLGERTVAFVESGTGGTLAALIGAAPWVTFGELLAPGSLLDQAHRDVRPLAPAVRRAGSATVGLAVRARERRGDTAVSIAIALGDRVTHRTRAAFLAGPQGRHRAALAACAALWEELGRDAVS